MARGWESKAVDDQIETATAEKFVPRARSLSPEQASALRDKKVLELSRARVARDLEDSQDPRYRSLLTRALEDIDAKLASFPTDD